MSRAEPVSADPVIHVDEVADPWSAVADAWKTIGQRASHLASGRHALEDGVLTVTLPAGRLLAEARRATEERAVHAVVERYYPPGTRLEVRAQVGTGSARDQQAALQRQLMEDPPTRRVIDALGAQIERVTALTDGEDE